DQGALGELYHLSFERLGMGRIRRDSNVWWNSAPHDLSILFHLVPRPVVSTRLHQHTYLQPGIADMAVCDLELDGGVSAHIYLSWLHPEKTARVTVVGSERMLTYEGRFEKRGITLYDYAVDRSTTNGRGAAAPFLAGGLLLALLLYHAGIGPVLVRLRALGWGAPLVLVPYLVIAAFDALGWRCTLPATARAPLGAVYLARMAGEAVNSLTPTAVTGEPLKAHLLRAWGVSSADGVASIVIAKTALTVSQIFFILLGLAALFDRLDQEALGAAWLALLVVIAIAFSLTLVRLQRRGPALAVWRWLRRVVPRADFVARLEGGAQ